MDREWSYLETNWKPASWHVPYRFLLARRGIRQRVQGTLQLGLFDTRSFDYEYKVIVTSKRESAGAVLFFHNGRGSQEALFAEAKQHAGPDVLPCRGGAGNQVFTLCAMMAHNLSREMQMLALQPTRRARPKRPAAWCFETLDSLRHRIIQRAGRLTAPPRPTHSHHEHQSRRTRRPPPFP